MHVLEAIDVRKTYREGPREVPVLRGVSLSVARGEVVVARGSVGVGQDHVALHPGLPAGGQRGPRADRGPGEVDPRRPGRLWSIRRKSIGFVFQQYNLFPSLTALENVAYALNLRGWRGARARARPSACSMPWGWLIAGSFRPRDLSGGQKQRVAIARALAGRAR